MAIYSGSGLISDSADGTFSSASVETLKIGIPALDGSVMLGAVAAFCSGGQSSPSTRSNVIDKFPFAISSGTATDVGDLTGNSRAALTGNSSREDGFASGGFDGSTQVRKIDKFPFSISNGTATDVGNLSGNKIEASPQSSPTDGFTSGGGASTIFARIDKFPFSISSGTATNIGDLTQSRYKLSGQSSEIDGYASGGNSSGPSVSNQSMIDKFPFSISSGNATDVGDLSTVRQQLAGHSSGTDGFTSGGTAPTTPSFITIIEKFPFAISSGTAVTVGDLLNPRYTAIGQQNVTHGFTSGGLPTLYSIEKFPFNISSGTSTDVGDLSLNRYSLAGHQD